MDIVFKCLHGSHLFGTQNDKSDFDYKIIFTHDLDSLIVNPYETDRTKNIDKNEETEYFSVRKFAGLLEQQQTVALEMLFAPPSNWIEFHSSWQILVNNRDRCISKGIMPFVGYAKQQSRVYSEKGQSYLVVEELSKDINNYIGLLSSNIASRISAEDYSKTITIAKLKSKYPTVISSGMKYVNDKTIPYTMILNKQFENHLPITEWKSRIDHLLSTFGERAKEAAQEGMDRKAMSHAVRIISEAIELCSKHTLTFPRPEVELLREIRYNESFTYDKTAEIISNLTDKLLLEVLPASKLQEKPNSAFLTNWYTQTQKDTVLSDYR